ncbi:hypothetical protein [Leucobacter iarius]|uniref:Uncharacterized protein n=1 Tax=Leucobacter iarius TaxID=333963 RepID=A0ABN2LMS2_9MICO
MTPTPSELPAPWTDRGDDFVLRIIAVDLGALLAPRRLAVWGGVILAALLLAALLLALVIGLSGGDWGAFGTAVFIGASIGIVIYLATLRTRRRVLEFVLGPDAVRVGTEDDGRSGGTTAIPYRELHRLLIVHDGAPTRIRIATAAGTRRWTIGQHYRHNSVEPFIDELPGLLVERLRNAGLVGGTAVRRGVRVTEWRPRRR